MNNLQEGANLQEAEPVISEMENGETTALETIPNDHENLDRIDDAAIVAEMTGHAMQEYVYSFKRGGRNIEGLTLAGINEAANRRGGIQVEEVQYEEKDQSWVAIAKAIDTVTGSSRFGAYEQPKMIGGKPDPFAFTKAIHKAQRNAIKQLIPVALIKEILNFYLNRQQGSGTTTTHTVDATAKARKVTFTIVGDLLEPLSKEGITNADLWNYMKRKCGVENQNDVTIVQWTRLSVELKAAKENSEKMTELCESIKQLMAAAEDAETEDTEPEKTEETKTNDEQ